MTRRHRRVVAAVAAGLVVLLAAAGCTSRGGTGASPAPVSTGSSHSGTTTPVPRIPVPLDPAAVNTADPEAVAEAVATAAVTWDTAVDTSGFDGIRRAAALLTPELAAQLQPVQHPVSGAQWAEATTKQSYNVPSIYTAQTTHGAPPDTAANVYRAYSATWVWVSATNQISTDPRTRTMWLTLALQPDGRWLVSTYDYTDL